MVSREKHGIHRFFFLLTAVFAIALLGRVVLLILNNGTNAISTYRDPVVSPQVVRGTITDRNGRILAMETPYFACAILLKEIDDLEKTATILGQVLGMSSQEIIALTAGKTTYTLVKRRLSDAQYATIKELIDKRELQGIVLEKRYGRTYPQQFHAAQLIGFTNTENQGLEGLELAFDKELSPYPLLADTTTYGADIQLTLDMDLQFLLDTQVVEIDNLHHGDYILGIIMGARTGEILAATTFPWYDPNSYSLSTPQERQNRLITYMYEPGSVFKVFSLAAEMTAAEADFSESFTCDGSYTFTMDGGGSTTINCVSPHGTVTPATMIAKSCNGAVAHWALQTSDQKFHDLLQQMGFGTAWDIGLRGSIPGLFPKVDNWSGRTKATLAFGQELGVTALQMATAATVLTNGGSLLQPSLIRSITSSAGELLYEFKPTIAREQVISTVTANEIVSYMVQATQSGGTAINTAVKGISVASKTGTAQILDPQTNSYKDGTFLASTLSIVPAADPKYIIYIAVANPKGATIWGSNIAAPAIRSIIQDMVRQGKLQSSSQSTVKL
ncbi:MAG: penicillin-binding protein 2 [Spirochaetae bacterium HGW-Spirochaetae-8]|nr:MAG: penicillin-binding protein 2 [Spirochaetae bacterium HGW-Spirochaetae-8]